MNVEPVLINFGFTTIEVPLVIVIIGTLLIGVLIAVMWSTSIIVKERNKIKKLTNRLEQQKANAKAEIDKQTKDFQSEKAGINKEHQEEKEHLLTTIERREEDIRDLNRRVHNLKQTRQINKDYE